MLSPGSNTGPFRLSNQDGYDLDQNDDGQVTSVCSSLYEMSAKCNVHMGDDGDYSVSEFVMLIITAFDADVFPSLDDLHSLSIHNTVIQPGGHI